MSDLQKSVVLTGFALGDGMHVTPEQVEELANAMWQLLDDMRESGQSVCLAAKAQARIAFEPFRDKSEPEYENWISVEAANRILKECS